MFKGLITFSNGATLEIEEDQLIIPISRLEHEGEISTSQYPMYKVWYHIHDGFIPSLTELLCQCDFFQLVGDNSKVYKSSAVVTIENL